MLDAPTDVERIWTGTQDVQDAENADARRQRKERSENARILAPTRARGGGAEFDVVGIRGRVLEFVKLRTFEKVKLEHFGNGATFRVVVIKLREELRAFFERREPAVEAVEFV